MSTRLILGPALLAAALAIGPARAQAPLAAEGCIGCHGPNGSGAGGVPAIAGRDPGELRTMLIAFRANERPGTIMGRVARGYTEAELTEMSEHFARQTR
jgi:sulfide dehydrogenase cytochrome subunit